MRIKLLLVVALACCATAHGSGVWSNVQSVVEDAIASKVFPGAAALVGTKKGPLFGQGFGSYTFGASPPFSGDEPITLDTRWDMASLTKIISTTTALALLHQNHGVVDLDMRISDPSLLGPGFANNGKQTITMRDCMVHAAGYPPDPNPQYWSPVFGCAQTAQPVPAMDFSCQARIFDGLLHQTLVRPPNTEYQYSDLSMITMMFAIGRIVKTHNIVDEASLLSDCMAANPSTEPISSNLQCYFEAFVRTQVYEVWGLKNTGFLPAKDLWPQAAPTETNESYQRHPLQGQVSDQNSYAMGGIAGHAGIFTTAHDLIKFAETWMVNGEWEHGTVPSSGAFLQAKTIELFGTTVNHTQSSRALGWATNDDSAVGSWNATCGHLSPKTYMHVGYTGTQLCIDPTRHVYTALLTNRVYPVDGEKAEILVVRKQFNNAVVDTLDYIRSVSRGGHHRNAENWVEPDFPANATIPFEFPIYKQCDPRWGSNVIEHETICEVGCLMSSISMAIGGHNISIDGHISDPGTLNAWLRNNGGYTQQDDLIEGVVPKINPQDISYTGMFLKESDFTHAQIKSMVDSGKYAVIANVMHGHHFVLVVGYPPEMQFLYVNDPGFNKLSYTWQDVVGWRVFLLK